ncbi:DUF3800 domain-containing protein [Corallococcus sp. 4LFB]|uniref:DUF3800 domain-containing protein n=1 Tax=Corallococcus sp. 4LFB TaxID=3383249 RepID=UPI0039765E59
MDECGYTGEDLADPVQPVFVVATHGLSDEECSGLKQQFFGHVQAPELKHMKLQGRARNEEAILSFLRHVLSGDSQVRFGIVHKPFALVTKMVDILTEEMMHRDGVDLYERGGHIALSCLIYYTLRAEGGGLLNNVNRLFQRVMRVRTVDALREFDEFVSRPQPIEVIDDALVYIRAPLRRLPDEYVLKFPENALDLSMTLGLQCMYAWKRAAVGEMKVIHDASSNMARRREFWDAILSPGAPPALVGRFGDPVVFPIGVKETVFANSKAEVGLQIADVIAGAVARWAKWLALGGPETDKYAEQLNRIFADAENCVAGVVWPDPEITSRKEISGSVSPMDYVAGMIQSVSMRKGE